MADNNPIKYSDLVSPDNSITDLIKQLTDLKNTYSDAVASIKKEASEVATSLSRVSGATEEGREKTKKAADDAERLAKAQKQLAFAQTETAREIQKLNVAKNEANRISRLVEKRNNAEIGSYDRLSAQYSLLKIRLNAMSEAQRLNTEHGKRMEEQANRIYQRMIQLQEATGKHTLSVGNYAKSMQGLNVATSQIIRELPAAAVSANTFFLAISNNIPMLIDQISLLRAQNRELLAEGKEGINVFKAVGKSLLSWNTILMLGVTALTLFGGKFVDMISGLFKGKQSIDAMAESQKLYNEAVAEGAKLGAKEATNSKILYSIATDTARSMEERKQAAEELIRIYPDYLGNMTQEEVIAGKASKKYAELTQAILENARAKAYRDKIAENEAKIVEIELQSIEVQKQLEEAQKKLNQRTEDYRYLQENTFGDGGSQVSMGIYVQQARNEVDNLNKSLANNEKQIEALTTANENLAKKIKAKNIIESQSAGGTGTGKTQQDNTLQYIREAEDLRLKLIDEARQREIEQNRVAYQRQIEDVKNQLATETNLTIEGRKALNEQITLLAENQRQEEAEINAKYDEQERKAREDAEKKMADASAKQASEREKLRVAEHRANLDRIEQEYDLRMSEIDIMKATEAEKTKLRLEAEKDRLEKILKLNESASVKLSDLEVQTIKNTIAKIEQEIESAGDVKGIYDIFGLRLSDEQKSAISTSVSFALDQLNDYLSARIDATNKTVESADKEVENAQRVLEAELQARANGYANNVVMAQKELDLAKKNQEKALKEQQKAQKAQEALQTIQQIGNLVTASAMIWAQLGFPFAIPALAVMWGSFAAAKIKAAQMAKTVQYGDGTVELLQGGSHQSGNDIDLGTKPDGTRRRAEGGEYFAVINKRSSRKYRHIIPDVIKSLNDGTFAKKYSRAFDAPNVAINVMSDNPDLTELKNDVRAIKEQNKRRTYIDADGNMVEVYKNITRKVKRV